MNNNKLVKLWFALLSILLILFFDPINRGITRYSFVSLLVVFTIYSIYISWKSTYLRFLSLTFPTLFLLIFVIDGKKVEGEVLRQQYIKELTKFEGSGYLWGGESKIGIDCSGLVRRGMIDANLKIGITSLNPLPIRDAISLWFYDSAADALMNGYRQTTKYVSSVENLNNMDYSKILAGDFMVTQNGVHTMAYIGDKTWIEADPGILKVIKLKVPEKEITWFKVPAKIIRWQQLD